MKTSAFVCLLLTVPILGKTEVMLTHDTISSAAISSSSGTTRVSATLGGYAFGTYSAPPLKLFRGFWFPRIDPGSGAEDVVETIPFRLDQNIPNPFNPQTSIGYAVPGQTGESRPTRLAIFDIQGRHVVTLVNSTQAPGRYRAQWTGQDDGGHPVGAGVYYCRLQVGDQTSSKILVLLK